MSKIGGDLQIINNIEIVCSLCGKNLPVEQKVGFEPEYRRYIFRAMPCGCISDDGDDGKIDPKFYKWRREQFKT